MYVDRAVRVEVPGPVQKVPAELLADCEPTPAAGTTVGAALDRLDSVEGCLDQVKVQLRAIRENPPAAAP